MLVTETWSGERLGTYLEEDNQILIHTDSNLVIVNLCLLHLFPLILIRRLLRALRKLEEMEKNICRAI